MTDRDHQPGNPWADASPRILEQIATARDRHVGLAGIRACRETLSRVTPPKPRRLGELPAHRSAQAS